MSINLVCATLQKVDERKRKILPHRIVRLIVILCMSFPIDPKQITTTNRVRCRVHHTQRDFSTPVRDLFNVAPSE